MSKRLYGRGNPFKRKGKEKDYLYENSSRKSDTGSKSSLQRIVEDKKNAGKIEKEGPDLSNGKGMERSKKFRDKLEFRKKRNKFDKFTDHTPFGSTSRSSIKGEMMQKLLEYYSGVHHSIEAKSDSQISNIFNMTGTDLKDRLWQAFRLAQEASAYVNEITDPSKKDRACENIMVEFDLMERTEWRLNNAGELKDKGRISDETLKDACKKFKLAPENNYRAFRVIVEGTYEREKSKIKIIQSDELQSDEYKKWFPKETVDDSDPIRNFAKETFFDPKYGGGLNSENFKEKAKGFVQDFEKILGFEKDQDSHPWGQPGGSNNPNKDLMDMDKW